jgi:uncharacterized protein (DUF2235 family)
MDQVLQGAYIHLVLYEVIKNVGLLHKKSKHFIKLEKPCCNLRQRKYELTSTI